VRIRERTSAAGRAVPAHKVGATALALVGLVALGVSGLDIAHAGSTGSSAWTSPTAIPKAITREQPALAQFNGLLYAAWTGYTSPYRIWYSAFNGKTWTAQKTVPSAMTNNGAGPGLAVFKSHLYVSWQGASATPKVWYSAFNGSTWSSQTTVPGSLTAAGLGFPALAAYNGDLYASWGGATGSAHYAVFNGTSWTKPATIPSTFATWVSLATFKTQLFASWETCEPGCPIDVETFNGTSWSGAQTLPSNDNNHGFVALAAFGNFLYDAWVDGTSNQVTYAVYNGTSWLAELSVPSSATCQGPGLAAYGLSLYAAWDRGTSCGSDSIEYSSGP
jgi:hypothetical protein